MMCFSFLCHLTREKRETLLVIVLTRLLKNLRNSIVINDNRDFQVRITSKLFNAFDFKLGSIVDGIYFKPSSLEYNRFCTKNGKKIPCSHTIYQTVFLLGRTRGTFGIHHGKTREKYGVHGMFSRSWKTYLHALFPNSFTLVIQRGSLRCLFSVFLKRLCGENFLFDINFPAQA